MKGIDFSQPYAPICKVVTAKNSPINPYAEYVSYAYDAYFSGIDLGYNSEDLFNALSNDASSTALVAQLNQIKELPEGWTFGTRAGADSGNRALTLLSPDGVEVAFAIGWESMSRVNNYNIELDFTQSKLFEFAELSETSTAIDFAGKEPTKRLLDMLVACFLVLTSSTEFLKYYKMRNLVIKNIDNFVNKFVAPYAEMVKVIYKSDEFEVGILRNATIYTKSYTYDSYLASIKECGEKLKDIFGSEPINTEATAEA